MFREFKSILCDQSDFGYFLYKFISCAIFNNLNLIWTILIRLIIKDYRNISYLDYNLINFAQCLVISSTQHSNYWLERSKVQSRPHGSESQDHVLINYHFLKNRDAKDSQSDLKIKVLHVIWIACSKSSSLPQNSEIFY